jgi:hypothetical protein
VLEGTACFFHFWNNPFDESVQHDSAPYVESGICHGGSDEAFPHISFQLLIDLNRGNPGSLVGTIQQRSHDSTGRLTCATTACQDLEYDFKRPVTLNAVFSTRDSSLFQVSLQFGTNNFT